MLETSYKVKTEVFEGPLDLLLNLIEKRRLFINDISLANVTDDFIAYVKAQKNLPTREIADFVTVASILLLIKSKSLLPMLELTKEEEGDIEDLERRLKEYQKIKELSLHVKNMFGRNVIFGKSGRTIEPIFSPGNEISKKSILSAARQMIAAFPKPEKLPIKTVKKILSLEETIEKLLKRIGTSLKTNLREFSETLGGKESIIVTFLAVLELFKRGSVEVIQETHLGEIEINKTGTRF